MDYYKISEENIKMCSEIGLVVCWSEDLNCGVVEVDAYSSSALSEFEVVTVDEKASEEA